MIRVVSHSSGAAAKSYYGKGLNREDYYSEGQEVIGKWFGRGAEALGLKGSVNKKSFERLCDNLHPETGDQLTPRNDKNRIVGFDINFHAPKSLSVVQAMTQDPRLTEAFRTSVAETMAEIENQTATRVRIEGAYADRPTGNLCWAEFVHFTARPVGGEPDPHLHVHAFVFNATHDEIEQRWKAAKIRDARQDMPMHQAAFHARLAKRVSELGYAVKRTQNNWEVIGISAEIIDQFSRRTQVVEAEAERRGLTDDRDKDGLGAMTREGKRKGLTRRELEQRWRARISSPEQNAIENLAFSRTGVPVTPHEAVDHALEKQFARDAVTRVNRVFAEAMRYGVGTVTPAQIGQEMASRELLVKRIGQETLCTTAEVLTEEIALVATVREGKGRCSRMMPVNYQLQRTFLSEEQQFAVHSLLSSNDRIMAMRGGAGTGKTTAMQEVVEAIKLGGRDVFAFAPSASASRETLREAGFKDANTVAHLLSNEKLQQQVRGHVIWIDEAGLLGTRDMWRVMEAVGPDTRIILTGDTRQHAPVSRGDPFRVMQEFAGLKPVEITEIRRQKPEEYRDAVNDLAQGKVGSGFARLDRLGAIREIVDREERYAELAKHYLQLSGRKQSPLVVSPTRQEGKEVTQAIRRALLDSGRLGKDERAMVRYHNLHWEPTQRRESENYAVGMMIQYHQNGKGTVRGEQFTVSGMSERGEVIVTGLGKEDPQALNLAEAERFQVFEQRSIGLRQGDRLRITRNGTTVDGRRLSNGQIRTVKGFTKNGDVELTTGGVIANSNGHFDYGYCQTSHSAQSKSVRDVLVAQTTETSGASSLEQFYVSVSRGQERIQIYTDDKQALKEAVGVSSARPSGLALANFSSSEIDEFMQQELNRTGWRKALQEHRAKAEMGKQVEKLLQDRRRTGQHKSPDMSWNLYLEKRRGLGGSAERQRGLSGPNLGKEKTKNLKPGHSLLKTTEHRTKSDTPAEKKPPLTPQYEKKEAPKPKATVPTKREQLIGKLLGRSNSHIRTVGQHKLRFKKRKTPEGNREKEGARSKKPPSKREGWKNRIAETKQAAVDGLKKPFNSALIRKIRGSDQYRIKTIKGHKMRVKARQKEAPQKEKKPVKQKPQVKPIKKR